LSKNAVLIQTASSLFALALQTSREICAAILSRWRKGVVMRF